MKNLVEEMGYETPEVKMVVVEVEKGFALSPGDEYDDANFTPGGGAE